MAESNWKMLKLSDLMDYGGELPARVVLEHDEADHSYRIFLETISADGKSASSKGAVLLLVQLASLPRLRKVVG